ncbi:aspartate aminotransferase [Jannaschia sp. EhC01]|nr:aspartate aminotransferase [Jannaschia sp. EhC01]
MVFPERFSNLPEYAFPRLRTLLDGLSPGGDPIAMTIGEPRHAFPPWIAEVLAQNLHGFGKYPENDGSLALRSAQAAWLGRRYNADADPATQILALNGTREGLYNACMALCPERKNGQQPVVLTPNPFYQVYAVAALSVGAEPIYLPATEATGDLPDFHGLDPDILQRTAIAYICSPANPQGAVASEAYWEALITLAEQYDFKIFADECYSEIYRDNAPTGALQVAQRMGADPERVMIFHSLSKRSNLPGLRSGFCASGPQNIARMKQLRAYSGAPLPTPLQAVAEAVWTDEDHVIDNRNLYRVKYKIADDILGDVQGYKGPEAGFFLWLPVQDAEQATVKLWQETGVKVLPGSYLAREVGGVTPGHDKIRVAMVAEKEEMRRGLKLLRKTLYD